MHGDLGRYGLTDCHDDHRDMCAGVNRQPLQKLQHIPMPIPGQGLRREKKRDPSYSVSSGGQIDASFLCLLSLGLFWCICAGLLRVPGY